MNVPNSTTQPYQPGMLDVINDSINKIINTISSKYTDLENSAPKVVAIAKKVLPFALLLFALIVNPIATLIGLGIGLAFSNQLKPIIANLQNSVMKSFKDSSVIGKVLIVAGAVTLGLMLPSSLIYGVSGIQGAMLIKDSASQLANSKASM